MMEAKQVEATSSTEEGKKRLCRRQRVSNAFVRGLESQHASHEIRGIGVTPLPVPVPDYPVRPVCRCHQLILASLNNVLSRKDGSKACIGQSLRKLEDWPRATDHPLYQLPIAG